MPHRVWKHRCTSEGAEVLLGRQICERCGQTGIDDGWHYSTVEMMWAFQTLTGFKPIGQHGKLVHELLLGPHRRGCDTCKGRGLLDVEGGNTWRLCPECDGFGAFLNATSGEIAEIRKRIMDAFPDSVV